MSDAPDGPLDTRGGKEEGDPGMEGATETGRTGAAQPQSGNADNDTGGQRLAGEEATDGEGL